MARTSRDNASVKIDQSGVASQRAQLPVAAQPIDAGRPEATKVETTM